MRMTSVYNILLIKVIRVSVAILCFSCSTALWTSLTVCMYVLCMLKYMAPFYCKLTNIANYRFSVSIFGFEGGGWITHKQTHNKRHLKEYVGATIYIALFKSRLQWLHPKSAMEEHGATIFVWIENHVCYILARPFHCLWSNEIPSCPLVFNSIS